MLNLAGYKEIEQLYVGNRTLVYRAMREKYRQPAIVKVLRNLYPTFNELLQFRNQYAIAKNLEHQNIVQPIALKRYGNGYALIMPDLGAIALPNYWQKSSRSLSDFLHIAIQLADVLHYLGQQRIIHKDIKPANILIHPETKQVKLIDFSISTLLPKEQQQSIDPNVLEGTLAYISPEQTGRMNRGIDYRTDFYSLGVTFYELLTGHLPFETNDPMELIHCHIAKIPPVLGSSEQENLLCSQQGMTNNQQLITNNQEQTPQVIANIVLKLIAKNAEDRYQSALGLKHDLEKCLEQLETTGEITGFEIGKRDICARFCIPEKIYGREIEVQTLLAAFARVSNGNKELMLVAGFSGIGKTAVINEVHKPIVKQRGYFIKGKFDQFNRNIPFSAIVQAFRDLMVQLLGESAALLNNWKSKIIKELGENGQVIIDVIPELELIIGKQPPVPELSGSAAQNRFNLLFSSFVRVFATKEHPLVIFLDDLQWADSASLNLLKLLSNESDLGYLLLLGAYRDNEVFAGHPLILTLNEIQKQGANLNTLTLAALNEVNINLLVADTLRCSPELAQPLAELVYQKTQGNPFFTTQFLQSLHEDGYITFDANALYWQCDLTQVRQLSLTADVVEFTIARLRKLPEATQEVLKMAACIGNQFDLTTLAVVCDRPVEAVSADLWNSLQEGFVLPENQTYKLFQFEENEGKKPGSGVNISRENKSRENKTQLSNPVSEQISVSYRFLHDRIQQAAYSLIPESIKPATHLKIGQLLLNQLSAAERAEKIFDLVNQLNYGLSLITQPEEREQLAQLNLVAGTKAKAATAYSAAENYFAVGRELLPADCWQSQYPLTLALSESAAEVAYLNGDFAKMEALIEEVLREGRSLLDRVAVYQVKLQAYTVQKQFLAAIETALAVLKLFGISFPESPTIADIHQVYAETKSLWCDRAIAELVNLPEMTDPEKQAALRILDTIISPAYIAQPQFLPLIVCEQVKLLIKNGNATNAAFSYGNYGLSLCAVVGDIESGYQFGQLASALLSKFNAKEITAKVVVCTDAGIKHWKEPVSATIKPLLSAYQVALETGDIIFATYCAFYGICNSYFAGTNLIELEGEIKSYSHALRELKQETVLSWLELHRQVILNLIKPTEFPGNLVGEAYNEATALPFHQQIKDHLALHLIHSHKLILNYLLEQVDLAMENAGIAETYLDGVSGIFVVPVFYFYDSLARLQWLNHHADSQVQTQLAKVAANQEKMAKWAEHAPANHLHKFNLVAAETHRVLGEKLAAIEMYDQAIAGAKENGFIQEEALANELAAKFYLDWGKETIAAAYMQQAYYGYARWGAKTKIDQLEKKYPQLLSSIRQEQQVELNTWNSLKNFTQTIVASTYSESSITSLSDKLDLASILQAAQSLSSTIELNPLLANICQIILTNSGAQKAMLLIPQDDQWHLRAMTRLSSDGHVETSIEDQALTVDPVDPVDSLVPIRLIQYVKNTQKLVVIEEFKPEFSGILAGYLPQQQPQSVLCLPLMNQGKLVAVLYLEHLTTKGVFSPYRQRIVQFFCTQAAISLQNAQLYDQAQQALLNLQQTQLQLVQSEKMSALGNLMAGIAHEINNPTNFLKGNIQPAKEYVKDLLNLISLYQSEFPASTVAIAAKISEIDLEFIREDLPNLLESMNVGLERIRSISKSLRTFSRKDEEQKTKFNIHDGIDSTLLILRHRTKAEAQRPPIQIIKDYGKLPIIKCFPGQLNQVFMNIMANAIDAFDEANQGKTYTEIKANPNCITIRTYMENGQVKIELQDNGCGMSPETQGRIFEQGFTTKEVGKGTGLGMAIAYQIITNKHGGTIECESTLGKGSKFTIAIPIGEDSESPQ